MLKGKDKGMLDQILPALIVIVLLAVLWTGSMVCASNIDRSSDVQRLSRTYLLKMEADGYLTEENRNVLLAELARLNVTEIDLTGTTLTDAGYGNPVRLKIKGTILLTGIRFRGISTPMMITEKKEITVNKVSVAKN